MQISNNCPGLRVGMTHRECTGNLGCEFEPSHLFPTAIEAAVGIPRNGCAHSSVVIAEQLYSKRIKEADALDRLVTEALKYQVDISYSALCAMLRSGVRSLRRLSRRSYKAV